MDFTIAVPTLALLCAVFQPAASSGLHTPKITIQPNHPEYFEGERIELICSASQNRTVEGYRFFDPDERMIHKMAANPYQKGTLPLTLQMNSTGNYFCDYWMEESGEATSGPSNATFIRVNEAPAAPSLSVHPELPAYNLGDSITLSCSAPLGAKEVKQFQYYSDLMCVSAMALHDNVYRYNLSIMESTDMGVFRCAYLVHLSGRNVLSKKSEPVSIEGLGVRWKWMLAVGGSFFTINTLIFLISHCFF
uniref:Ig-like domain-containing protein n=1 Tax=Pogona vitticeps TaxID=103695 RepID=A0A6J0SBX8_9SAUR